jgi:hypothetical protein
MKEKLSVWVIGRDQTGWGGTAELVMDKDTVDILSEYAQTMTMLDTPYAIATSGGRMIQVEEILAEYKAVEGGGN